MDNKYVVIIILVVVLVAVVAGCLYFVSIPATDNNHVNETNITNNATNSSQEDAQVSTSSDNSDKSSDSQKEYDDWQEDYETGEYDENGNPIYRSVFSTSGGQYDPGVYESYWSSSGPISEERIG